MISLSGGGEVFGLWDPKADTEVLDKAVNATRLAFYLFGLLNVLQWKLGLTEREPL